MKGSRIFASTKFPTPVVAAVAALAVVPLAGCASSADKVSDDLGKQAEQFGVQRRIVVVNGITDKVLLEVEGRCSIESGKDMQMTLSLICKQGPDSYKKHFVGLSDNTTWTSTQLQGLDANEYRTRFILKPENIVPNFDLQTGERP